MLNYLIMRIKSGHMNYDTVVSKYPQFKEGIDKEIKGVSQ